ncbi:hypothetical protein Kpol_543p31 [Vanderwaltozyma polyspora DSM 70294]|uniref:Uncharacterized protein n=1 Tax=Vanderwaltozyma polyspora (strain ATCC 22028 / DSM 70294 / BCRC 21397 / CBS 2163 / NBRC 10782 / NRRL Y-8283 / UCD 57-17) TaxID=436907 RepID=A7THN5_VANPO|nr:uncharacterized protein Kpol_543p31 [Vanderwaltozyma polyspora DSM 70294]EDO18201.1 hypothetical protein Kpol_543p31 [Vanderwaltozyma polyspora DSM 70294]
MSLQYKKLNYTIQLIEQQTTSNKIQSLTKIELTKWLKLKVKIKLEVTMKSLKSHRPTQERDRVGTSENQTVVNSHGLNDGSAFRTNNTDDTIDDNIIVGSCVNSGGIVNIPKFKFTYNQHIDPNSLRMIRAPKKNASKYPLVFAEKHDNRKIRYCQVSNGNTICNKDIKFMDDRQLSKRGAEYCEKHIKNEHPLAYNLPNIMDCLNREHSPVRRLFQEQKKSQNILNMMNKVYRNSSDTLSPFEEFALVFAQHGFPLSMWESKDIRLIFKKHVKGFSIENNRKQASEIVKKASDKIVEYFQLQLEKYDSFRHNVVIEYPLKHVSLESEIHSRISKLSIVVPPYVSMELDDWKADTGISYSSVIFSLTMGSYKKGTFQAKYTKSESKTKPYHRQLLVSVCDEYKANDLWTNTCTDNASDILQCSSELVGNPKYPVYAGHVECLYHILGLICEEVIKCICLQDSSSEDSLDAYLTEDESNDIPVSSRLDIPPLVSDPFAGRSPTVLAKLIRLGTELKKSEVKLSLYKQFVSKQIPSYSSERWDIKHNILKTFVDNQVDIFRFFEHCRTTENPVTNELDIYDFEIAELLVNILSPLEQLVRFMSQNISLSSVYIRTLLFAKSTITDSSQLLKEMENDRIDLSPAVKLVDKYLQQARANFDVIYTCTPLYPFKQDVFKYYEDEFKEKLNPISRFANILMQLGKFDFQESEGVKVNETLIDSTYDIFDDEIPSGNEEFNSKKGVSDAVRRHLIVKIKDEMREYIDFYRQQYDTRLAEICKKKNIEREKSEGKDSYKRIMKIDSNPERKLDIIKSEIFLVELEAYLEIQKFYRECTRSKNTEVSSHEYLPVVMDYLLSFAVTSVNAKKTFSKLEWTYDDQQHIVDDSTAFTIANLSNMATSNLNLSVHKPFEDTPLDEVLRNKKKT